MSVATCFELEKCEGGGCRGSVPGSTLNFNFSQHFCDKLAGRWERDVAEVLISLPSGRVFAANRDGHYATELTGGILGAHHMIVIVAAPDWEDPDGVAVVTVYPEWSGKMDAPHIDIVRNYRMELVPRRRLLEVLRQRMAK